VRINVSKLDQEPLRFSEELSVDPERLDFESVTAPVVVRLEGEVRPHGDHFTVSGRCRAESPLACSRCLEPAPWMVEENFAVDYRLSADTPLDAELGLDDDDLNMVFIDGDEVDLSELAAEQVLLALPMRHVCDEGCAGLCPQCGANRNREGACSCEPEIDPRWRALADLAGTERDS
jgi:uncharacterized protein